MRNKLKLLVVLQCAYGTTLKLRRQLGKESLWLRALWMSHTGRVLKTMIPNYCVTRIINSSNYIGEVSKACFPPNITYIQEKIKEINPDVILACGKVAQKGLREIGVPFIEAPHPAWRSLTKEQRQRVRDELERRVRCV